MLRKTPLLSSRKSRLWQGCRGAGGVTGSHGLERLPLICDPSIGSGQRGEGLKQRCGSEDGSSPTAPLEGVVQFGCWGQGGGAQQPEVRLEQEFRHSRVGTGLPNWGHLVGFVSPEGKEVECPSYSMALKERQNISQCM